MSQAKKKKPNKPKRRSGPRWAKYVYLRTKLRFPKVRFGGIFACRKIAGTDVWSQHAWGNAVDIFVPSLAYGDAVSRWLRRRRFNVAHHLWRTTGHYDHIHLDFRPNRRGRPPCAK